MSYDLDAIRAANHLTTVSETGIYCIRNLDSGRQYIGQAIKLFYRKRKHFELLRCGTHKNAHLQRAFVKHGEAAFVFSVVELCAPEHLTEREQYWIDVVGMDNLYNIVPIAGSRRGATMSDETRRKISAAQRGKKKPPPRSPYGRLGIKRTPDQLRAQSIRQTGKKHSAETKNKISDALRNRTRTKETYQKIGAILKQLYIDYPEKRKRPKKSPKQIENSRQALIKWHAEQRNSGNVRYRANQKLSLNS